MEINPSFWQNKRIFLTGHTGFKGSWLALWLSSLGAKVTGYALAPNTEPNLFDLAQVKQHITSQFADIRDFDQLNMAVQQAKPDIILHLAAQPLVRYSYQNPIETYATNVMGTVHILEAMRHSETTKILVNVTTDKCYENKEWAWGYREIDRLGGHDPYSNSKGCSELVTAAYRASYFDPKNSATHQKAIASARAGNVIGGGDWSQDRLVPDILNAFAKNEKPVIRYPHAIRPWQHVLEPLSGYLSLAEKLWHSPNEFAEGWNFGPRDEDCQPVSWIVENLCQQWGNHAAWELSKDSHPHEANFLKLDISKAKTRLKWYPRWSLQQTLAATVDWHKQWLNGTNIHELCLQQIALYNQSLEKNNVA